MSSDKERMPASSEKRVAAPSVRARFVGRQRELAVMGAALADLAQGRGALVLLSGEPGIGKTRLAEELAGSAVDAGVHVRWGRCHELDGRPPYWPWAQIVQSAVRNGEPEALAAAHDPDARPLVELIPELRNVRSTDVPSRDVRSKDAPSRSVADAATARFRLFRSVTAMLSGMAARHPLLLVLDDVHWADLPSLLLLEFLAHELPHTPIVAIVTYRAVEVRQAPVVAESIGRLCRRGTTLQLDGLSLDEVAHFVDAAAGRTVPAVVAARLHARTEGNPFFLDEIVRLSRGDDDLLARGTADLPVSEGVRAAIRQRLAPLPAPTWPVLDAAAVLGREFDAALLAAVLRAERADVVRQLRAALDAELVDTVAGRPGRYRFAHALVRETIYESLAQAERGELHRTVAEILVQRDGVAGDTLVPELAHHFYEASLAGDDPRAVDYAERAGRQALRMLAWEEAALQLGRALHLLEAGAAGDPRRRCELLLALGQAHNRAGLGDESKRAFHRAAAIARQVAAPDLLARAATGLCEVGVTWAEIGRCDDEMIGVLEEALSLLGPDEIALRARVMARLATELLSFGPTPRTEELSTEAVLLARRTGDPVCTAHALLARIHCRAHPDQLAERAALIAEVLELTGGRGDLAVNAYLWRLGDDMHADRVAAVRATREVLLRTAVELRQPGGLWLVHAVRAQAALLEGRFADAQRAVEEMLEQPSFKANVEQAATAALFLIQRERGGHLDLALALEDLAAQYPGMSAWSAALAMLWGDAGDADRCRAALDAVTADGVASVCHDSTWLFSMSCLAEACGAFGSVAQAELLYDVLTPYAGANTMAGPLYYLAPVDYYLGVLARVRGRFTDAASHLANAATSARRLGARPMLARILLARARVVEEAVAAGVLLDDEDRTSAVHLRREALQHADALDLVAVRAACFAGDVVSRAALDDAVRVEPRRAALQLDGDTCVLTFAGRTATVKNVRGCQYLARLLAAPGREFHVLDLVAGGSAVEADEAGVHGVARGDLGPLLDGRAKAELARRCATLREELADAERAGDRERIIGARAELEAIGDQLAAAVRLDGRDRRAGDPSERARAAVTKAIRAAIARIERADPELGDLLARTVRTGTFCAYAPLGAVAIEWSVGADA
jgi:tetratricopeptide (TPR) repeat protein